LGQLDQRCHRVSRGRSLLRIHSSRGGRPFWAAQACQRVTFALVSVQPRWYDAKTEVLQNPRTFQ
jgi:hypothetical protein